VKRREENRRVGTEDTEEKRIEENRREGREQKVKEEGKRT
jgi:hypothetical protein